ncbi:hypothetical protein F5X68DRAFT_204192 [Plectosphaerella plurivora]|uniref:Uncharacterized protein n=1 Tax=Plectosphaerella plurivora TaxID=936078 RepID=A0A9P8VGQ0_9PEZI|nr:hypothetical protein F5X68DRAFT_204192 [Plectosphaerella plurivora]
MLMLRSMTNCCRAVLGLLLLLLISGVYVGRGLGDLLGPGEEAHGGSGAPMKGLPEEVGAVCRLPLVVLFRYQGSLLANRGSCAT